MKLVRLGDSGSVYEFFRVSNTHPYMFGYARYARIRQNCYSYKFIKKL